MSSSLQVHTNVCMHVHTSISCMHIHTKDSNKVTNTVTDIYIYIYTCTDQHKAETVSHQCGMEACSACCTGRHSSSVFSSSANPTSWSKTKKITIWLLDQMPLSLISNEKTTTKHSNFFATITTLLWNEKSNCLPVKLRNYNFHLSFRFSMTLTLHFNVNETGIQVSQTLWRLTPHKVQNQMV